MAKQGDVTLLQDPVAQQLLQAPLMARLAYSWTDGSPRVVPIWFHWTGQHVVMAGPPDAPKVGAIRENPAIALTIDNTDWPYEVLLIRGTAEVEVVDGVAVEYAAAAKRYFGDEQGAAWVDQVARMMSHTARISVLPRWVGVLDFRERFPQALAKRM